MGCHIRVLSKTETHISRPLPSLYQDFKVGLPNRKKLEEIFKFHISWIHDNIKVGEWAYLADMMSRIGFTGWGVANTKFIVFSNLEEAAEDIQFCKSVSLYTAYTFDTNRHQRAVRGIDQWV